MMPHFFWLLLTLLLQAPDTIKVPAVVVSSKNTVRVENVASPVSSFYGRLLSREGIEDNKGLTARVPNLYVPDYGAALTSSIYLRGFGSRIDNPVLGLYIDDIPLLEKNAYDSGFLDIESARLFRGPHGTLYGRNTSSGVLDIRTLSPSRFQGWSGEISTGSALESKAQLSYYMPGNAFVVGTRHSNGFFTNDYTGRRIDRHNAVTARYRLERDLSNALTFENTLLASYLDEGGFAYGRLLDGELMPPAFDGENGYRRFHLLEGAKFKHDGDIWKTQGAGSIQILADRMRMDQDFTPEPVFTLEQRQRIAGTTVEFTRRPAAPLDWWDHTTGVFAFWKINLMSAPVEFLERGTRRLILDNANRNIPSSIGQLDFDEYEFPVLSDFIIQTWNTALFHESVFTPGRWIFTAGLRIDYEGGTMSYNSRSTIHYRFLPIMTSSRKFETNYRGREFIHNLQLLPKASVLYDFPVRKGSLKWFASFSKGHKAGGFNTQIFSDILQSLMMNGLIDDLGVHLEKETVSPGSGNTIYKPEEAYNIESGLRFRLPGRLSGTVSFFAIECRNQQLTVFPTGQSTGRMMTNAGRSSSIGGEAELELRHGGLDVRAAYGYNRARFTEYNDGNRDYSGNTLPYAPSSTLSLSAGYRWNLSGRHFSSVDAGLHLQRTGRIWWDDANTLSQDPYFTIGAHISVALKKMEFFVRGENLTNTRYNTFYFKSVGNEFLQVAKPARFSTGISFKIERQ